MQKLGTDYVDLYLIHWPKEQNVQTWQALETLYKEGRAKAIGVSNFKEHHLDEILQEADITPMVNQVEYHPLFQQKTLKRLLRAAGYQTAGLQPAHARGSLKARPYPKAGRQI